MIIDTIGKKNIIGSHPNYNSLTAVAKGATRYAYMYQNQAVSKASLVEYIPQSIGVEIIGDKMNFIAKKGDPTPIPHWKQTFITSFDNQEKLNFVLKRGDSEIASNNECITEYTITNLPKGKKGQIQAILHVDIEQSGNMIIKAVREGGTEKPKEVRISCGFDQTDEKLKDSMDKIKKYCPK